MSLNNKHDVWADLRYALDEMNRPSLDIHSRLKKAANIDGFPVVDEQSFGEWNLRLLQVAQLSSAYSNARSRADTRNAHEAIEKGLKSILLDSGLSVEDVRGSRHELYRLLLDVQKHNPMAFGELERCFNVSIQFLTDVTSARYNTNIVDYFQKYGKSGVFVTNRYESLEGRSNSYEGMIGFIYREMIYALMSVIFGRTARDITTRIEQETSEAILSQSKHDPAWDVEGWLNQGAVRPRLEYTDNLANNKVLRLAVRRCAKHSEDYGVRHWARWLRREYIAGKREARLSRNSQRP